MVDAGQPAGRHVHVLLPDPPVHAGRVPGRPPLSTEPRLHELRLGDEPGRWSALGFAVGDDGTFEVGGVRLALGAGEGAGVTSVVLEGVSTGAIDGLRVRDAGDAGPPRAAVHHPNGIVAVDHLVVATPDFRRTLGALGEAGLAVRREREVGDHALQAFFVVGPALLELVGPSEPDGDGPASFWGITFVSDDLDATARVMSEHLGEPRDAVQPGRRIATVRRTAGLGTAVAVMTPRG